MGPGTCPWWVSGRSPEVLSAASPAATEATDPLSEAASKFGQAAADFATEGVENPFRTLLSPLESFSRWIGENAASILWRVLLVLLVVLLTRLAMFIVSKWTGSAIRRNREKTPEKQNNRLDSIMTLIRSASRYIIFVLAFALCLQIIFSREGSNFNAFVTIFGAFGAGAVAIGFGTQDLVKDIISGLLFTFENQFNVGDYIRTQDQVEGTVTAMALRVTYIRTPTGQQVIIPNRMIERISNFTHTAHISFTKVPVPYDADITALIEIIDHAIKTWGRDNEAILLEPPVVQGVDGFTDRNIEISILSKAKPLKGWEAERGIRLAVKKAFDAHGIAMPRLLSAEPAMQPSPSASAAAEHPAPPAGFEGPASDIQTHSTIHKPIWQTDEL